MRLSGFLVNHHVVYAYLIVSPVSSFLGGVLQDAVWSIHCRLHVSYLQRSVYVCCEGFSSCTVNSLMRRVISRRNGKSEINLDIRVKPANGTGKLVGTVEVIAHSFFLNL